MEGLPREEVTPETKVIVLCLFAKHSKQGQVGILGVT